MVAAVKFVTYRLSEMVLFPHFQGAVRLTESLKATFVFGRSG